MELCKRLLETDDVCVIDSLVGCNSENDNRAIPMFIRNVKNNSPLVIHGTGKHTRAYTYVEDTVNGILLLTESYYNYL